MSELPYYMQLQGLEIMNPMPRFIAPRSEESYITEYRERLKRVIQEYHDMIFYYIEVGNYKMLKDLYIKSRRLFNMKDTPGIGKNTFTIRFKKNHFNSNTNPFKDMATRRLQQLDFIDDSYPYIKRLERITPLSYRSDTEANSFPRAFEAIYTRRFIKSIKAMFIGIPFTDEQLEELSKTHLAAALLKEYKTNN